ncbi:MAG: SUMF1/EgtB/PvdO family nonheme iron enzyme [Nitrospira sp.]|nr:SUMF1/EgtB/PvdO family nonheme iron enzyme [Nitrospira sp.]
MSSIFISHSSRDNSIAEQVAACLKQRGHRSIFLDFDPEVGIPPGREWEKELYARLRECLAVIVLCSHASMASRWCFAEITHAKALGKEVFPIKIDDCKVDPILTAKQIIDATAEWDTAYRCLEKGLLAAGLDPNNFSDWDGTRAPYPGLMAFQEQDAAIFFGRDKEIREGQALLNRLQEFGGPRLALVLGASGSGKSSLMRASLLPRLKGAQRWVVIEPFRPLKTPFDELALVISKRFDEFKEAKQATRTDLASVRDRIRWNEQESKQSVDAFLELVKEVRETAGSREATVLLMIDQYEKLLTLGANDEGNRFLAFLRAVLDREDSGLLVSATLRSDFLGSFQDHPAMRGLRFEPLAVPQMQVDDFASVIEGPARVAGLKLGPGLVQALISDTKTADALPLLAFTLRELYEGYGQDRLLTLEEYRDKLGRLDGCIARAAGAVLSAKPLAEKEVLDLRTAFLSMVRVADDERYAKQPVQWNDLPASIHHVLERFVRARLLISDGDENVRTLEMAHEALFRAWPKLAGWIEGDREDSLLLRRAEVEAGEWMRQGYDPKHLWHTDQILKLKGVVARRGEKSVKEIVRLFMAPQDKLVARLQNTSLSHRDRLTIGQNLAALGDRRPGVGLKEDGLPDIEWIEISEGHVNYDDWKKGLRAILRGLHGAYHGMVHSFRLAKYPVTNEQFTAFLNSEDGFGNGKWWKDIGPIDERTGEAVAPAKVVETAWQDANLPRVEVSWYEAVAFCRWLSSRTNQKIGLPTEWEWQLAATDGDPEREYPWKGGWDDSRCNSDRSRLIRTTAVGMYPQGATEQGVMDMAGNVLEWCLNTDRLGTRIERGDVRMLRGGSWFDNPVLLRASERHRSDADHRDFYIGFRLAQDIEP